MRILALLALLATALPSAASAAPATPAGQAPLGVIFAPPSGAVTQQQAKVGKPAPNFTMEGVVNREFKKFSLSDYRGKWLVLFFYPLDFTFVCPTEITGFDKRYDDFRKLNAEVMAASVDSKYSHAAWIKRGDLGQLRIPMLSDLTKETSRAYGILDEEAGVSLRGLFIIDPNGVLQYMVVHNQAVGRNVDEALRVLQALQTGEQCPLGWKPGEKTLGKE